jgi:hypothetical protein
VVGTVGRLVGSDKEGLNVGLNVEKFEINVSELVKVCMV